MLLTAAAALAAGPLAAPARSAPAPGPTTARWRVTQLLDASTDQQEISRDYATGVRLALAESERSGGRAVQLSSVVLDGSAVALERALRAVGNDPTQLALLGTAGERLSLAAAQACEQIGLDIAHVAPWLADSRRDTDARVFPIFASRDTQIGHALQSLASIGIQELGLVYANAALEAAMHGGLAQAAQRLSLRTQRFVAPAPEDAKALGARLPASSPAVLLFLGGTVELALFTQGLAERRLQRYVICLSDIDVATLMQIGPGQGVPLVFVNVVPNPQTSGLPIALGYRASLKALYDEAPAPLSLAGYIAGRYALQTFSSVGAKGASAPGRAAVLAAFQRRAAADLGGFRIRFASGGRGSSFVNQSLLQANGKLLG